jgi:hypothetical protein
MATKTDICNLALSELGNYLNQITDYDTGTGNIAAQCRLHYPRAVEELCRMHTWNCATKRDLLVVSSTVTSTHWSYVYDLPTGSLRVLSCSTSAEADYWDHYKPVWALEGKQIVSNDNPLYVKYIKEPDAADMDSMFLQCLYKLLAAKLAVPVEGDSGVQKKNDLMNELLSFVLPEARRIDGFENEEDNIYKDSDWLNASFGGFSDNSWMRKIQ